MTGMGIANSSWPGMVALWLVLGCRPEKIEEAGEWASAKFGPALPDDPVRLVAEMSEAIDAVMGEDDGDE